MKVVSSIAQMHCISAELRTSGKAICLVPTMGYFHDGHISLIKKACTISDTVVVSLFVNPTQFGPNEDFQKYPRDIQRDCEMAEAAGVDYLFVPDADEMYPFKSKSLIHIPEITDKFDGAKRPGHFDGVATVVAKLFNIVQPNIAIFGQKDYQQTLVIKRLVEDYHFNIDIIISPTVRMEDGLAMSSRNTYLGDYERQAANILYKAMKRAESAVLNGETNRNKLNGIMANELLTIPGLKIDYAAAALASNLDEPDNFVPGDEIVLLLACFLGKTRLIDNWLVTLPI